jgi:hypothetical protein
MSKAENDNSNRASRGGGRANDFRFVNRTFARRRELRDEFGRRLHFAASPVRVHGSPHGLLLIDNVRLLSKIANCFSETSIVIDKIKGFTGPKCRIANRTKGPHGFTGQIPQARGAWAKGALPLPLRKALSRFLKLFCDWSRNATRRRSPASLCKLAQASASFGKLRQA